MYDVDAVNVSRAELSLAELDDGELLALTRSGNQDAYAALFQRYSYAALRLARHLGQREESDDVVSESFAQVLDLLNRGKGPDRAFRAYLFTTVRHECGRRAKARQRVMPTDDDDQIDAPVEFGAGRLDMFERTAIRAAYESLPARWRTVLWHLDVEGRKPNELGPLLDLSPNSVSALVYRARSGLREAYLQQHVNDDGQAGSQACLEHRAKLSAFVRRTASARDQEKIHAHLQTCKDCLAIYLDLQDVNREVGSISASAALAMSATAATGFAGLTLISGGLMSTLTNIAVLTKGVVATVVPTVAAAAITTATLVGPPSAAIAEPTRTQIITATIPPVVQQDGPELRAAAGQPEQAGPRPSAGSAPGTASSPVGPNDAAASIPSPPAAAPAAKAATPAASTPAPKASEPKPAPKPLPAAAAPPVEALPATVEPVTAVLPVVKDLVKVLPVDLGLAR